MKDQQLPTPPTTPFIGQPEVPVSKEPFADNAEVRRVLIDCLHRLGMGQLAPSLQKRILKVLHPGVVIPKRK